jgi:hypothetical protein
MDASEYGSELDSEVEQIIGRVSGRLANRFVWELRLRAWTNATLVIAAGFAVVVAGDLLLLTSLAHQASEALFLITKTLS